MCGKKTGNRGWNRMSSERLWCEWGWKEISHHIMGCFASHVSIWSFLLRRARSHCGFSNRRMILSFCFYKINVACSIEKRKWLSMTWGYQWTKTSALLMSLISAFARQLMPWKQFPQGGPGGSGKGPCLVDLRWWQSRPNVLWFYMQ